MGRCPRPRPSRSWPATSRGRRIACESLLDEAELTQALEEIWKLVRRLNQYVEETKPWELAKDDSAADRLDASSTGSRRACG